MKVLVVEDSERLRRALGEGLRRLGFVVDLAGDGIEGLKFANAAEYDVIVLDIMLPGVDGLTLLKNLRRRRSPAQVLILSAKDQVADRVNGLELGADDYLVKPFAFEELLARIKSLGRRRYEVNKPDIEIGELIIDTSKRQVRINGTTLSLTPAEYNLLQYLALRRGNVISKSQLQDRLSDADSQAVSNVIEVLVSNLRKKISAVNSDTVIQTKRGFGYYIE
jgi:two-component system copper resistance phosphate regulon response regulator CusR